MNWSIFIVKISAKLKLDAVCFFFTFMFSLPSTSSSSFFLSSSSFGSSSTILNTIIWDKLFNLSFASEDNNENCLVASPQARTWNNIEDAIKDYCLSNAIDITINSTIDFFINYYIGTRTTSSIYPSIIPIYITTPNYYHRNPKR